MRRFHAITDSTCGQRPASYRRNLFARSRPSAGRVCRSRTRRWRVRLSALRKSRLPMWRRTRTNGGSNIFRSRAFLPWRREPGQMRRLPGTRENRTACWRLRTVLLELRVLGSRPGRRPVCFSRKSVPEAQGFAHGIYSRQLRASGRFYGDSHPQRGHCRAAAINRLAWLRARFLSLRVNLCKQAE